MEEIEVGDLDASAIAMPDREGRARHGLLDPERPARAPDEGGLPAAELARDGHDVPWLEPAASLAATPRSRSPIFADVRARGRLREDARDGGPCRRRCTSRCSRRASRASAPRTRGRARVGPERVAEAEKVASARAAPLDDVHDRLPGDAGTAAVALLPGPDLVLGECVAEPLEARDRFRREVERRRADGDVDRRLRGDARDRCAPDVLDLDGDAAERSPNAPASTWKRSLQAGSCSASRGLHGRG